MKKHTSIPEQYPGEVVTSLSDLMRFEYYVQQGSLLPVHPVFSLLAGRHASKLRGRGLDFEEVRKYVPGDDIRNIDWRVTARTGVAHAKVFNEEKERPTFIVLDQTHMMFFGSVKYTKSVTAAHAAALGAFYTVKRGDRVGGLIFNEEGYDHITPKRSTSLVQHFMQLIVARNNRLPLRKQIASNADVLHDMIQRTRLNITHDYVVTIISDFSLLKETTKDILKSIANHNDVILVHIYDPMEEQLPGGKLILGNGKRQLLWQNNKHDSGKKFTANAAAWRASLSDELIRFRIPVVFLSTAICVEQQVKRLFQT